MPAISPRVREASSQDAAGCLAIYRPYVENSAVSWELDVPTIDEMAQRITAAANSAPIRKVLIGSVVFTLCP